MGWRAVFWLQKCRSGRLISRPSLCSQNAIELFTWLCIHCLSRWEWQDSDVGNSKPGKLAEGVMAVLCCMMDTIDDSVLREEALHALSTLIALPGGAQMLLEQPASLISLEVLASAACFLTTALKVRLVAASSFPPKQLPPMLCV